MHILEIRPEPPGGKTVARFDVQLNSDCRLYGLKLVEVAPDRRLTYAPDTGNRKAATFSPDFSEQLTRAASDALEAMTADEQNNR